MRSALVVLSLLTLVLSGCAAQPADTPPITVSPDPAAPIVDDEGGWIQGLVTDDSQAPVPQAEVVELRSAQSTLTDEAGRFRMGPLPAGPAEIVAAKIGYVTAGVRAQLPAGETIEVTIMITAIEFAEPYSVAQTKTTYIDCGLYVIRPVNCNLGEDRSVAKWEFGDLTGASGAWFETAWKPSGDLMKAAAVSWVYTPAENERGAFLTLQGTGPLRKGIEAEILKRTDRPDLSCAPEGCNMESRHGPPATAVNTAQPGWIGLSYQQRIDDWVTIFFHGTLPAEFTALPRD